MYMYRQTYSRSIPARQGREVARVEGLGFNLGFSVGFSLGFGDTCAPRERRSFTTSTDLGFSLGFSLVFREKELHYLHRPGV